MILSRVDRARQQIGAVWGHYPAHFVIDQFRNSGHRSGDDRRDDDVRYNDRRDNNRRDDDRRDPS